MNEITNNLSLPEVSLNSLLWNLLICMVLSAIMCWHYNNRAQSRYLRRDLGLVLPIVCLTTLLVISVVKSSLALSLGLVGALSIVRFRTPIKEPEELAYIFLAIAIGLALGADQRDVAVIALPIILSVISLIDRFRKNSTPVSGNLILSIEVNSDETNSENLLEMIESAMPNANLRRFDQDGNIFSIVALVKIIDKETINHFSKDFQVRFPQGRFSIIDDSSMPNE
jgi:hypothetical protein